VAGVGEKKANVSTRNERADRQKFIRHQEPELVNGILQSIQGISDEARRALADPELPRESMLSALAVSKCTFFMNLCF